MGNQDGIVSGFLTALAHAIVAALMLFVVSGGDGPYVSAVVFILVIILVCCVGLVVRSHFSSLLLLILDGVGMALAIVWCISAVIAFQEPPSETGSFAVTSALEGIGHVATLVAAAMAFLLSAWLTRRAYRLEKRLRRSRRKPT